MTVPATRTSAPVERPARRAHATPFEAVVVAVAVLAVAMVAVVRPVLGVGLAVALVAVVVTLARPDTLVLAVLALVYSNAAVIGVRLYGVPAAATLLLPLALALPLLPRLVRDGGAGLRLPAATPLVVLLAAVEAASAALADDPRAAAGELVVFATEGVLLFVLVAAALSTSRLLHTAVWVVVLVGAALGALSVYQHLTGTFGEDYFGFAQVSRAVLDRTADIGTFTNDEGRTGIPRQAGPIGEQNRYAQVMLVLVPLGLALARLARTLPARVLALGATVAILSGIALTYSRGAAVALAAVLVVGVLLRLVPVASVAVLVAGALLVALVVPGYTQRLASLDELNPARGAKVVDEGAVDGSVRGRATENLAALETMADHPVLGVGPGAFPTTYRTYAERIGGRPRLEAREAHNLYLGLGAELGLVGLACFLVLVGTVLRGLWTTRRDCADRVRAELAGAFLLALMLYLASGVFLHMSYQRYFWLLLAMAAAAATWRRERSRPAPA